MQNKNSTPATRIGLFVEGVNRLTPRNRDNLRELWRYQCGKVSQFPIDQIEVYGFSKQQLILMAPSFANMPGVGKIPLDVFIEQKYQDTPFHRLVVAFDAYPPNQAITAIPGAPCLRLEKDFLLERFAESAFLPQPFRAAASALLVNCRKNRGKPRVATRPPLGDVEIVYMEPMYEVLALQDEKALRAVFGLGKTPRTWPALPYVSQHPDFALRNIVDAHRKSGPRHLRVPYDTEKHAWAHEVLKNASTTSPIWKHVIALRLRKALT